MRSMMMSFAAGAALLLGVAAAQAMPATVVAPGSDDAQVIPVAGGCGPGAHRDFRGFCVPGGFYGRPVVGPRCFIQPSPFGPRRVCTY